MRKNGKPRKTVADIKSVVNMCKSRFDMVQGKVAGSGSYCRMQNMGMEYVVWCVGNPVPLFAICAVSSMCISDGLIDWLSSTVVDVVVVFPSSSYIQATSCC